MTRVKMVAGRVTLHSALAIVVVWSVLPLLWTFQTSIKFTRDVAAREPVLWGYDTTAAAYRAYWFDDQSTNMWQVLMVVVLSTLIVGGLLMVARRMRRPAYLNTLAIAAIVATLVYVDMRWETSDQFEFFINSIIVTAATICVSISIGLLGGYGLARYSGKSGAVILISALAFRALPRFAFVLPFFIIAKSLGLLDSRAIIVLALVAVNQPFTIWMLRTFFLEVPKELEEAAMMDGATRLQAFVRVVIPTMKPGIIATSLFTLLLAYNEFLFVRVLAPTNWTLPVGIVALAGGESSKGITEAAAAAISITLPIVIVIIMFQKHLVKGLGSGAVKG
ncbi:MAG: carbohydrate ABC transporter permease [Actinobacteria bacterium]|nr:carbohydrate ABC transporter permease [Actinomycetota bacterium]NBO33103.1 carbohydrate ABC transporter permease [Actinomycetota bacterium]NBP17037.1 carbohydrate ABC transporter permease [Actinomycetota bacterium]NBR75768.1 carbohydrate ABC transporter permease [Actinomycetota bacterium]NBR91905.1 carbohydrate ABC transporter permease [Actinomycetota bacterium]